MDAGGLKAACVRSWREETLYLAGSMVKTLPALRP